MNTVVSLKQHFDDISVRPATTAAKITFTNTMDFAPHGETYLGELPMLYSFSEDFANRSGQVEIKDGFFSLVPLLLRPDYPKDIIFPKEAELFLDRFYISEIIYRTKERKTDMAYIHMDYYQEYSSLDHIENSFLKIKKIASEFKNLKVCFSEHSLSSRKPNDAKTFYQRIRSLPENCEIISNTELFELAHFKGRSVYLLTDQDYVLKSPWENIFAARGAIINHFISDEPNDVIQRIPIGHNAEKVIIQHTSSTPRPNSEVMDVLTKLASMIKRKTDLLNPNYLRELHQAVKTIQRVTHVN